VTSLWGKRFPFISLCRIGVTMSFLFSERALLPERMDVEPLDEATTRRILSALEHVNACWAACMRPYRSCARLPAAGNRSKSPVY